jgi:anti-sigma regulatory factor (Ser/Thr protein kinase)
MTVADAGLSVKRLCPVADTSGPTKWGEGTFAASRLFQELQCISKHVDYNVTEITAGTRAIVYAQHNGLDGLRIG